MINFYYETFPNFGFIKAVLSDEQIKPIKDEIDIIKNNFDNATKFNDVLAGNIEKEFKLKISHSYIESLLLPLAQAYLETNNYKKYLLTAQQKFANVKNKPIDMGLESVWVNFQNKHEFNPIHNHSGFLSFVIWIDIPFLMSDELEQLHVKNSSAKVAGNFAFVYTDILGNINPFTIEADKTYNNGLLLFPATLNHVVYPFFTTDKQRISVSGNFHVAESIKENELPS